MNVNLNKVKKRASLNGDGRISTENSEPFFKGSLVEICILSYAPYSFSEKHALKHELMPFFSETRLGKIGRWLLNPQDSSLSEKHISALEQSAAAELAICAAMKNSGRPFAPSDYAYKESGQPTIQNGHISISHTEGYAACAIAAPSISVQYPSKLADILSLTALSDMNWSPLTTLPICVPISGRTLAQASLAISTRCLSASKDNTSILGICPKGYPNPEASIS